MSIPEKYPNLFALLTLIARLYIGSVFIMASLFKIWEPYDFALSVATYQMAPLWSINIFSIILPWVELITGVFLVIGLWTKESAFLICCMMIMFLVALFSALSRDLQMSCGCFASQETFDEIGIHTVFRDLGWLLIAAFVLFFDNGRLGLDRFINVKGNHA